MAMSIGEIEGLLRREFPEATIEIRSLANDNDHYGAVIVSEKFRGKSRIQQHQMVFEALGGKLGTTLHALTLQTSAPS